MIVQLHAAWQLLSRQPVLSFIIISHTSSGLGEQLVDLFIREVMSCSHADKRHLLFKYYSFDFLDLSGNIVLACFGPVTADGVRRLGTLPYQPYHALYDATHLCTIPCPMLSAGLSPTLHAQQFGRFAGFVEVQLNK